MCDHGINLMYLKGVGAKRAELLASELGIRKIQNLLSLFPNKYIDRTHFYKVNELKENSSELQLIGKIKSIRTIKQKKGSRLSATFEDDTGTLELVWFRGLNWIKKNLEIDVLYVIFGRTNYYNGNFSMPHPEIELLSSYKKKIQTSMQAIYPSTEKLSKHGITNRIISKILENVFKKYYDTIRETLSDELLSKYNFISKKESLLYIHFPKNQELLTKAQFRLKFEELFFIQLQFLRKKVKRQQNIKGYRFDNIGSYFNNFYKNNLNFDLTNAQKKVLREIRKDLGSTTHMNRLLQGDVGSGKTIVALLSILIALDNGFQAALIVPTEILALQHYDFIKKSTSTLGIRVSLLTGSVKMKERKIIHESLENGDLHILVGTHALLEDKVKFHNLGLAIIDEQHRFGVAQRSKMWSKNKKPPHIMVMTATPIPRTLAMSVYGDLDISVIDELPVGRKSVKTFRQSDRSRLKVFKFIKNEIEKGRQAYIVYPLIEESDTMDYKDLMDGYESISKYFPKPKYQLSILHGRMKYVDREFEINRFIKGETQIMVCTTVIEVGVNIPNASIMLIENAERFGLSQLHQLRGRVGRGTNQSYCILMTGFKLSEEAKIRLNTMVKTSDGFEIAEVDLKLRGPGNIMGTQQSGVLNLKIADIVKDQNLLRKARTAALEILKADSNLKLPKNKRISDTYLEISAKTNIWSNIS